MRGKEEETCRDVKDVSESIYIPAGRAVCLVFAVVGAAFTIINIGVNNMMMVYINGALFALMSIAYLSIIRNHSLKIAIPIICVVVFFTETNYLITGGEDGFSILWILLVPPIAIYMMPLRKAFAASAGVWLIAAAGLWSPLNQYCYDYTRTFEIRFPLLYMAEIAVALMIKKKMAQVEHRRDELLRLNIHYKEEALQASRAKSDFLASMSHEIRTPINVVLGMNEMILRESTQETILQYAANVDASGKFLLSLVNDILDISKIESGKMELICSDYTLSSLLNDVLQMAYTRAEEKLIRIVVQVSPDIPDKLYGDGIKICQVLTNLVTNAIKYTDAGGSVTLNAAGEYEDEEYFLLTIGVKDTGKGIRKADIPKLFDSFIRVDEKSNRSIEGTGLGLAISNSYVGMMEGKLQVESEYGQGSYFYFTIRQKVVDSKIIGNFGYKQGSGCREILVLRQKFVAPEAKILVVDDNEMNRAVVRRLLKRTCVQMDFADSGAKCLQQMEGNLYDVVLLDHMMPDMDGIETLRHIRQRYPENRTKVIALTANAISGAKQMYLENGFDDYVTKPIDGKNLEKLLMQYLPEDKVITEGMEEHIQDNVHDEKKDAQEDTGFMLEELREWKKAVPELDILTGMEYSMEDKDFYLEMLQMYVDMPKLGKLNQYYQKLEEHLRDYRVAVHALKSTSLNIGLVRLSEEAKQLELAARREDCAYIRLFHEKTMLLYDGCMSKIQKQLENTARENISQF